MKITDEMIETACAAHWGTPWPGDRAAHILAERRQHMHAALAAALIAASVDEPKLEKYRLVLPDGTKSEWLHDSSSAACMAESIRQGRAHFSVPDQSARIAELEARCQRLTGYIKAHVEHEQRLAAQLDFLENHIKGNNEQ